MANADDDAFCADHGEHFFDCTTAQFSERDLGNIFFPDTMLKLENWITAGYVKPDLYKDPEGGRKERRRYNIVEVARIAIIDSLTNGCGLKPSQAVEVADFSLPFLNDSFFDRHPDRTLKSNARIFVLSWLDRQTGRMKSKVYFLKPDDKDCAWYEEDPYIDPTAKPGSPPGGSGVYLPLTDFFIDVFMKCGKYLAARDRGLLDKWGRPLTNA